MPLLADEQPVVNEAIWNAWVEKGKRMDKANTRNMKIFAGIMAVAIAARLCFVVVTR